MIKSYQRLPINVSAIQWDNKPETFKIIKEIIPSIRPYYVNCLRLDVGKKFYVAELNDYVIVSNPARVIKLDEFKNEYKENTVSIP